MKSFKYLFAITILILGLAGCKYSFIVPEDIPITDPNDPNAVQVSFAEDIQPIFDASCVFCHNGTRNPNLTSGNSFSSLNSNYVNKDNPEGSKIYTEPAPSGSHGKRYTAAEAALVLGWIKQGAKNN